MARVVKKKASDLRRGDRFRRVYEERVLQVLDIIKSVPYVQVHVRSLDGSSFLNGLAETKLLLPPDAEYATLE